MSRANNLENKKSSILKYLDEKIRPLPYILELYLVGSRGRGTNREDSDWDIHILSNVPVINFTKYFGRVDGYNIDFTVSTEIPKNKKFRRI